MCTVLRKKKHLRLFGSILQNVVLALRIVLVYLILSAWYTRFNIWKWKFENLKFNLMVISITKILQSKLYFICNLALGMSSVSNVNWQIYTVIFLFAGHCPVYNTIGKDMNSRVCSGNFCPKEVYRSDAVYKCISK